MRFTKGHLRLAHKEIWNAGEHIADCINEYLDKMLFSFKEISNCYKNDPCEIYFRENLKKEFSDFEVDENCLIDKIEIPDYVF